MDFARLVHSTRVRVGCLILCCFLLGSTGWLYWLRRIMDLADPLYVDLYTMVLGYLAQAVGIGVFMAVAHQLGKPAQGRVAIGSVLAYIVLLEPATMSDGLGATLAFGYLMNIACGMTQGFYLSMLAELIATRSRGVVFGAGYAASTFASWLISGIAGGALASGLPCLTLCAVLALLSAGLMWVCQKVKAPDHLREQGEFPATPLLVLAGVTVVLVSLVKNAGFSFPAEDLSGVVNLELSRLFYGVGLIVAGVVADRDRRYVLACCAASLAVPFLMLALTGAGATGVVLWAIGYLLFGFFTVFRITLFADLAAKADAAWLAGAGLLLGRLGDVLGTAVYLAFDNDAIMLIIVSAAFFAVSMGLLFELYRRLYVEQAVPAEAAAPVRDERAKLAEFCATYDLSAREREVLPLLVAGKTNAEIAAQLYVTEATAKYHVRNIRRKTGCETRLEVADLYARM